MMHQLATAAELFFPIRLLVKLGFSLFGGSDADQDHVGAPNETATAVELPLAPAEPSHENAIPEQLPLVAPAILAVADDRAFANEEDETAEALPSAGDAGIAEAMLSALVLWSGLEPEEETARQEAATTSADLPAQPATAHESTERMPVYHPHLELPINPALLKKICDGLHAIGRPCSAMALASRVRTPKQNDESDLREETHGEFHSAHAAEGTSDLLVLA